MFAEGHDFLRQLQYMSNATRGQPHLAPLQHKLLRCMRFVRACVDDNLRDGGSSHAVVGCRKFLKALLEEYQTATGNRCPDAAHFAAERAASIAADVVAVAGACSDSANEPVLRSVISALRALEETKDFHARLLVAQEDRSEYPQVAYAYGSTPLTTWCCVLQLPAVATVLKTMDHHPEACTVFGSSTGSLVFYTALLTGRPVRGVEILPCLVADAQAIAAACAVPGVDLQLGDMLDASLAHTRLLVLTSQCWPAGLWADLVAKLRRHPGPLLVLDYTERLSLANGFRCVGRTAGDVSWHKSHAFYAFERHDD
ncbi:hypothetical protein ACHHYP_09451 [Achlya hypogyna]|uniref:DOT1 domain-containing protein n=1 Tax=Achlya hypogyna TaxID=1202772 RepID=A0A1V9ZIX3_ACHHY|nr:hypothetical protein ACHHYP_09451 [Achlya hypogyna]